MNNNLIKTNTKSRQTDRNRIIITGVAISLILIATPFLFYIYKFAPSESKEWDTVFGTLNSNAFGSMQTYMHALFTKITFVMLTAIWFLTANNWWKYAILVPFTMFLFQLSGVINSQLQFIDEYDFWYSLPFIAPIIGFVIYSSYLISKNNDESIDLKSDATAEIHKMFSDDL
ncbi:MAG: hypothetical protein ACI93P_001584 [bacterium]|jgi:hypothetical protein